MQRLLSLLTATLLLLFLAACDSAEERAEGHYDRALELMAEGDPDRAIIELRNVFRLVPNHLEARHEIARIFLEEKGNTRESYSQYLRLVEQYPDDILARTELSKMAFLGASWDEFIRHGERAQQLAPDNIDVQAISVGLDYRDALEAEDDLQREAAVARATNLLGTEAPARMLQEIILDNHLRASRPEAALDLLNQLIDDYGPERRYLRQRLQVYIVLDDQEGIERQLLESIELFPEDVEQRQTLIRYYLSRGELDKTEALLRDLASNAEDGDSTPRVDLIRFLLELRGEDAARREIDAAIATEDDVVPFVLIGASIDFTNGETDKAIASLEEAIAAADESSREVNDMRSTLAKMLLATGNEVGARSLVETVLTQDANHVESLKMNAEWLIEADETDQAIAALRVALDSDPDDAQTLSIMARAYQRDGRQDLARDFLALAVEASGNAPAQSIQYASLLMSEDRYRAAEDILLPAIRIAPNNVDLLRTIGQLYLETEDTGRMAQVIEALRRIETPQAEQIAVNLEAALINQTEGTDDAIAFLENLASQEGADASSKLMLLRARIATGDRDGALSIARSFAEEDPDSAQARLVLAKTYIAVGELEDALEIYTALAEEFPNNANLIVEYAALQLRMGDADAGRATVFAALEANPESPSLMWAAASYFEREGDIDAAIATYEDLYALDTNSLVAANNLASLLATYRDDPESLERAWNVARRFRDSELAPIQDTFGWIQHRRGDSEDALPYLQSAAAGLPEDPIVQFHLAEVLFALDQKEQALAQYRLVLEKAGISDTRAQIQIARDRIVEIEAENP